MRRSPVRFIAVIILALLGAPLVMHVVLHDLHDHQDVGAEATRDAHEHPVISSAAPHAPAIAGAFTTLVSTTTSVALLRCRAGERSVVSFGGLRLDDDTGLQSFLSTFLI